MKLTFNVQVVPAEMLPGVQVSFPASVKSRPGAPCVNTAVEPRVAAWLNRKTSGIDDEAALLVLDSEADRITLDGRAVLLTSGLTSAGEPLLAVSALSLIHI